MINLIKQSWTKDIQDITRQYDINLEKGLSKKEVKRRQQKYGLNKLKEPEQTSKLKIMLEQFKSVLVLILVIAVIVSFFFKEYIEAITISIVIIINAFIGYYTELKAIRSMESLRSMVKTESQVLRDGKLIKVVAENIVPGDIVFVNAGDIVSADIRLFEASKLKTDESALTGESIPVDKQTKPIDDAPLAERNNMLYKGTAITKGSGKGIVIHTGIETEVGQISEMVQEAGTMQKTPLEERLDELGKNLVYLSSVIIVLIVIGGLYRGEDLFLLIETALALAVATVPEGLPIVATITLARGMKRMADQNALINKLSSVETLGSTNIIATDKTGTLTENEMTITSYRLPINDKIKKYEEVEVSGTGRELEGDFFVNEKKIDTTGHTRLKKAIQIGVLCNNSSINKEENNKISTVGDPTETALLVVGEKANMSRTKSLKKFPEEKEVSFDAEIMMMATYHKTDNDKYIVAVKGSPPDVLERTSSVYNTGKMDENIKKFWLEQNEDMASQGKRVLGLATKIVDSVDTTPYKNLEFVGLVGLLDPPRSEVKDTIKTIYEAGIRVIMVTGDQKLTALNIAQKLNLSQKEKPNVMEGKFLQNYDKLTEEDEKKILDTDIFYRVEPKEKLNLINVYQNNNKIVAMTGDGVNDAPALRKADIGVAMGVRGTQVAQESSDMILQDDNFSTIKKAIKEGRNIYKSIQKFVYYLLSCNISEILVIFFATIFALPLPIRPIQILYLNIVTDVFPAFALSMNEADDLLMKKRPRDPESPIINKRQWAGIGIYGLILTFTVLASFIFVYLVLGYEENYAVTIGYVTLGIAQLFHVFNMRDSETNIFDNQVTRNKNIWYAMIISMILIFVTVYVPGLNTIMKAVGLKIIDLGIIFAFSTIPVFIGLILDKAHIK